ncbi:MAG TPA: nucleotidyl transferase AbiEii/AbiGii toxin family protein [Kofleriaceae bacterium]|nr:nucleotidyl transferase AbiEii/AbiGii toxin family protein [Kofleriaceae bacterium]
MALLELDRARIERFLARAADRLDGDWLLVGGAAAAVWFAPDRTTEDIDLVGREGTNAERLRLMEVAEEEGLPVEAVNSAADFFVRRIPGWDAAGVVLRRGATATIHRPVATTFLLLKINRLSEQDLDDCLALLAWCGRHGEPVDRDRVRAAVAALRPTNDPALADRRRELDAALAS